MNRIIVAAASLNQTPLAWDENVAHIREALRAARKAGARVVCLPELCVTGYGCEDAFHSEGIVQEARSLTMELARESRGLIVNFGLPLLVQGVVYNTVAVAVDGALRGFVAKQHLPGEGVHYEPRWFTPWPRGVVSHVRIGKRDVPVGDIIFEVGGVRIGFEICEDAWVAERPGIVFARHGVDLILNPSASHFAFGKHEIRKRIVVEGSRAYGAAYIYANLLGCESGRLIYDGDTIIASHGEIVGDGERFSYRDVTVTTALVDIARSRLIRRRQAPRKPTSVGGSHGDACDSDQSDARVISVSGFSFVSASKVVASASSATAFSAAAFSAAASSAALQRSSSLKHEEFTRAVTLGLFDYLRKSRSEGFVVSLSGGVDSSAAGCLVALMAQGVVQELGLSGCKKKLAYIPWMRSVTGEREIVSKLLTCVYQATRNSSATTREAAQTVAREIGASFLDLNIDSLVEGYKNLVSKELGVTLSWGKHDLALQNIQARTRSPSIWLVANLRRALLLTTSNRSEASVGYTTMDGDSSGGLSPLGGIDKAYLREWSRWLEVTGPQGLRSFPSLALVNAQEPTAELRPRKERQTDERDLMPYEVLDSIERCAVRDKLLPIQVFEIVRDEYKGRFSKRDLGEWVIRFFTLWSVNQWKRERLAPSFHLDDENVDPKTWCRFPILSGGFTREIELLRKKNQRL